MRPLPNACCRCGRPFEVHPNGHPMAGYPVSGYTLYGSITVHSPVGPSSRPSIEAYSKWLCPTCWPIVNNALTALARRLEPAAAGYSDGRPWSALR